MVHLLGSTILLQRFGLLHPPKLIAQTIEDLADRVRVGKFLVGPAFLVDEGLPHRLGRDSRVQKRRLKLRVRLAFGIRQGPDIGTISRHIICSGQLFAQFFRSHPEELPEAQRGQLQAQQAVRRLILSVPGPELV